MYVRFSNCPNEECALHKGKHENWYIKKGYFKTKWNRLYVPRYKCKTCGKLFSTHTFKSSYRQKKPFLNEQIFKWYASGTTQRRMAKVLGINRKTVIRKFLYLARKARKEHERRVAAGELKTSYVQFDEMETFEHTKLKPLSIAIAVRPNTFEIIEAQVATLNCKGFLAKLSQNKYGWRVDNRHAAREDVLRMVNTCSKDRITVVTDGSLPYPGLIKKFVPHADIVQAVSPVGTVDRRTATSRRNKDDLMFAFNHIAAKIRHDLSRMARKVWTTTKCIEGLQAHLDLYIAYNNGYKLV